jgi:hypothetical protein
MLTVSAAKDNFFDRAAVVKAIGTAKATALRKSANRLKITAQRSMKPARRMTAAEMPIKRKRGDMKIARPYKSSAPGEAPRTRASKRLRKGILASYDKTTASAVIGPTAYADGSAPKTLEEGGTVSVTIVSLAKQTKRKATDAQAAGLRKAAAAGKLRPRQKPKRTAQKELRTVKARPFMAPALKTNLPTIAGDFSAVVR